MESDERHMDELRLRVVQWRFSKAQEWELGWFAGIIDGECSFGITVEWGNDGRPLKFGLRLQIYNTDPRLYKQLHKMGIESSVIALRPRYERAKQSYMAVLGSNDMRMVLPRILDYFILKREQAEAMLKALHLLKTVKKSEARDRELIELREEIMMLNHKEWPPET